MIKSGEAIFRNAVVSSEPAREFVAKAGAVSSVQKFSPVARDGEHLVPVLTLVLWLSCSVVTVLGFAMPYARPHFTKAQPAPMNVEMVNVELSNEPLPELEPPPQNFVAAAAPPPSDAVLQPQIPQAIAVAMPSPAVAFALPVEGETRVVEAAQASYSVPAETTRTPNAAPAAQQLTFGQGAGKQPAPEYPSMAQDAGQEGVVNVRFVVAENGRVTSAEAVSPSPWPLLNDAAVRVIRNRWRFPAGKLRVFEVAIRFVLPK